MKQRFITYAICASILFHMTGNICYAKEESYITTSYPSIIEEYDELYFLENMYMENIYYENYYSKEMKFQRIDLTNHPFGQELRHEIEYLYALQQTNHIDATLKHSVDFSYEEYVDIVMNTYIEFIKYYQYQEFTIQPDYSTSYFTPYIKFDSTNTPIFCVDISIDYANYE